MDINIQFKDFNLTGIHLKKQGIKNEIDMYDGFGMDIPFLFELCFKTTKGNLIIDIRNDSPYYEEDLFLYDGICLGFWIHTLETETISWERFIVLVKDYLEDNLNQLNPSSRYYYVIQSMDSVEEDITWLEINPIYKRQVYYFYYKLTKQQIEVILKNIKSCFSRLDFTYNKGEGIVFHLPERISLQVLKKIHDELFRLEYHMNQKKIKRRKGS